jgi:hypothetical protein
VLDVSAWGNEVYLLANDEDQAGDDLGLLKKVIETNPVLKNHLAAYQTRIARHDGRGFVEVLPAKDVAGAHGKTYRLAGFDEIHEYRSWDLVIAGDITLASVCSEALF